MQLQLLEQLCHEHGILAAGNTDRNFIPRLYQFVCAHRLRKLAPDFLVKFLADARFHFLCLVGSRRFPDVRKQPVNITAGKVHRIQSLFRKHVRHIPAKLSSLAADDKFFASVYLIAC